MMLACDRSQARAERILISNGEGPCKELARLLAVEPFALTAQRAVAVRGHACAHRMSTMATTATRIPAIWTSFSRSLKRNMLAAEPKRITPMLIRGNTLLAGSPLEARVFTTKYRLP